MLARFAAVLTAFLIAASPALASVDTAVMNKEGYWSIDADGDACVATMTLQGGTIFLFRGHEGDVAVALSSRAVLPKGKTLTLEADGAAMDLPATFPKEHTVVYLDGALDAPSLAKLRGARQLRVLIDGQAVAAMTLEGAGFPEALDSLVACSHGKSGWWGKGVQPDSPAAAKPDGYAYNAEDVWLIAPLDDPGVCIAQAATGRKEQYLQFFQEGDEVIIGVWSSGPALRKGRKGELMMDGGSFSFTPSYDGKTFMVVDSALTGRPMEILRATKGLTLQIDGKTLVDANLEGTGFPKVLDELAACSRGETGWWTPNAEAKAAR